MKSDIFFYSKSEWNYLYNQELYKVLQFAAGVFVMYFVIIKGISLFFVKDGNYLGIFHLIAIEWLFIGIILACLVIFLRMVIVLNINYSRLIKDSSNQFILYPNNFVMISSKTAGIEDSSTIHYVSIMKYNINSYGIILDLDNLARIIIPNRLGEEFIDKLLGYLNEHHIRQDTRKS